MSQGKQADVIVIGAGMAGIMAARTLRAANRSVIVLEARSRVGGRTHTAHDLGSPIDLGAAWIHGQDGNPLLPLARRYNIPFGHTDFINRAGDVVQAYDADGRPLDMQQYSEGQFLANGAFYNAHGSVLVAPPDPRHRSLKQFLEHDLPQPPNMSPTQAQGFYYWSTVLAEYLAASDSDLIDWQLEQQQHLKLPGGDILLYGGGFNAITDKLAAELDIRCGVAVTAIDYGADDAVLVDTPGGQYRAAHVVISVPLGVLKAGALRFAPALPAAKTAAIERIGFGNYEKLVLRFDQFYWPRDKQRFNYLSRGEPSLFNVWLNVGHYNDEPIIIAYHAGRRARKINEWDDQTFIAKALAVMQRLFADSQQRTIPPPLGYLRSNWQHDPFSQGSYSFDKVGQQIDDRRTLAQPVADRLFFAGEASHPHYYATVHGAFETGIRAARELLTLPQR